jgi:hypothetical protein
MDQKTRPRLAAVAVTLGIFLAFAGDGIHGYFAPDEMMNLYQAWFPSLGQLLWSDRPLGSVVYRVVFALSGLNPVSYRLVCFILLLANLALLYQFCKLASGSREMAAVACLVGAYHAHLADLYYTSSILFDLLCFFFSYAALTYYMRIRSRDGYLNPWQTVAMLLLYVCALGSKEMAVALPVWIVLYELIYQRPVIRRDGLRGWLVRHMWFVWISIPITLLYIASKTAGAQRMTINPSYQLHFSPRIFLAGWRHYLPDLFYGAFRFTDLRVVLLWAALVVFALVVRRRELLFAWCITMVGALPFIFIPPRGFYAMYMTLPGWYLFAGSSLILLRDKTMREVPRLSAALGVRTEQLALFTVVAGVAIVLHWREKPLGNQWVAGAFEQTKPIVEYLDRHYPKLPHGAKILFLSDQCPTPDYILSFIFALRYNDQDIRVDRAKSDPALLSESARAGYDHVFAWDNAGVSEVPQTH